MTNIGELRSAGWRELTEAGYATLVGPFWERRSCDSIEYGLLTGPTHANRNGTVHGGVLLGLADQALGYCSSNAVGATRQATVQLDMHFVAPALPGDFIFVRTHIIRQTRSIMFVHGEMFVGERLVATATGLWKLSDTKRLVATTIERLSGEQDASQDGANMPVA